MYIYILERNSLGQNVTHVVPKLYGFLSAMLHKIRYFEEFSIVFVCTYIITVRESTVNDGGIKISGWIIHVSTIHYFVIFPLFFCLSLWRKVNRFALCVAENLLWLRERHTRRHNKTVSYRLPSTHISVWFDESCCILQLVSHVVWGDRSSDMYTALKNKVLKWGRRWAIQW